VKERGMKKIFYIISAVIIELNVAFILSLRFFGQNSGEMKNISSLVLMALLEILVVLSFVVRKPLTKRGFVTGLIVLNLIVLTLPWILSIIFNL
jgi:hypothetical protein